MLTFIPQKKDPSQVFVTITRITTHVKMLCEKYCSTVQNGEEHEIYPFPAQRLK